MKSEQAGKQGRKIKGKRGEIVRLRGTKQDITGHKKAEQIVTVVGLDRLTPMRKMGIDILGDAPWGTHFCLFYHTKQDLIDILVPYFKAGLENNEFCMWVTSEPLSAEDAEKSLSQAVTNLDDYIKKGQIEILDYTHWYTKSGAFEADKVLQGWVQKHDQAIRNGFDGLRLTGNTLWLEKKDWKKFADYEAVVNSVISEYRILAICTYSLEQCGASEILDVERNHQFALIKWKGDWRVLESSDRNQIEARLAEQTIIAQALERSKKEWVKTFNAMSDWVVMMDLNRRILRTNRIGEQFTGFPLDEIAGQNCCKLVHGSEKQIPGCPVPKMLRTGRRATTELQIPGSERWLMVTVDPVTDEKGSIVGAAHIARDITGRKRAEEEREKLLRAIQITKEAVSIKSSDLIITYANDAMYELFGYKKGELTGKHVSILNAEAMSDATVKRIVDTIKKKGYWEGEVHNKRKDGTEFITYATITAIKDEEGKISHFISTQHDITGRKRAEEALRVSEEKYRKLTENSLTGIFIHQDGKNVFVNDRFAEIHGYAPEELLGADFWRLVHPDDRAKIAQIRSKRLAGEETPQRYEMRRLRKDGQTIWCEMMASRIEYKGAPAIMGNIIDITERKRAGEELSRSRDYLDRILSGMYEGLMVVDRDFTIRDANNCFLKQYGGTREDIIGHKCYKVTHGTEKPCSGPEYTCSAREVFATGKPQRTEHIHLDHSGKERVIDICAFGLFGEDGNVEFMVELCNDITERKQAEGEVAKLAKFPSENQNPVLRISAEGIILFANKASRPVLETWGVQQGQRMPDDCYERVKESLASGAVSTFEFDCLDGRIFLVTLAPVIAAGYVNAYGIDITERKKAEEKLLEDQEQLRSLASQLSVTEERERRTIAKGLHDEIIQPLVFLDVKLTSLLKRDAGRVLSAPFKEMQTIIAGLLGRTRSLTFDLSCPVLYELGLEAAVKQWLTTEVQEKHGLKTVFKGEGLSKPLGQDTRSFLYKAIRELLNNVVKHAMATLVEVSICYDDDKIIISVRDDGKGFDARDREKLRFNRHHGYGLFNIRERVKDFGGTTTINSEIGKGTEVIITMPANAE